MAPVPVEGGVRYIPVALVGAHLVSMVFLTFRISTGLFRSYKALSPSQDTRTRLNQRAKLVPLFTGLAAISVLSAAYSSAKYGLLSYQVWADQRGITLPDRVFGSSPHAPGGWNTTRLHVAQWLSDTPIYYDALEILAEKARRFWWSQQLDLSMVSWSLLLAIEGRRRNIPYLSSYLLLSWLVNLSFAQNMFYIALLLTPAPIAEANHTTRLARLHNALFPPKPANWCPNPRLYLGLLLLNYFSIFLLPYAAETVSFSTVLLATRGLALTVLALPNIAPASWGTVHRHPHSVYGVYNALFQTNSIMSALLHVKATFVGLAFNTPDAYYHRHSIRIPFDTAERTSWERTTTAVGKILGSTNDHPVVAAVGRDVVLSAISLGLWAAVRALDSRDMLISAIPFYNTSQKSLTDEIATLANKEASVIVGREQTPVSPQAGSEQAESTEEIPTLRRSGRSGKTKEQVASTDNAASTSRRRGRPRKSLLTQDDSPDATYQPTAAEEVNTVEGDIVPHEELDWESAALAWGIAVVGGLGSGSAAVYGSECVAR